MTRADQEHATFESEETFDPDTDIRDYDDVARNLPVFCVSSRAYQKLSGKLRMDDFVSHGYASIDDTEIPQLQAHAMKLTENDRVSNCKRFLNELNQLLSSLCIWVSQGGRMSALSEKDQREEQAHLDMLHGRLKNVGLPT